MTTIVLAHPNESCPRFEVFGEYEAPNEYYALTLRNPVVAMMPNRLPGI